MQQKSGNDEHSKNYNNKTDEYVERAKNKQSSLSIGYTTNSNSDSHKSILASPPPPPPPSQSTDGDTASQGKWSKPRT